MKLTEGQQIKYWSKLFYESPTGVVGTVFKISKNKGLIYARSSKGRIEVIDPDQIVYVCQ